MRRILLSAFVLMYVFSVTPAEALLIQFPGRTLWWDQDANPTVASGYDADGLMYWADAMTWADNLVVGNLTDWELPNSDWCIGYDCKNSVMGDVYYNVFNAIAGEDVRNSQDDFINLQGLYWTKTLNANGDQMLFDFSNGAQSANLSIIPLEAYVMAVHPDPATTTVPEPASLLLIGSGLVGLLGLNRRRSADMA